MRRIVITSKELYIALLEDEITRDLIPLCDVESVEEIGEPQADHHGGAHNLSRGKSIRPPTSKQNGHADSADDGENASKVFSNSRHANVLKITTIEGGYNAGRTYSLQAPSRESCAQVQ